MPATGLLFIIMFTQGRIFNRYDLFFSMDEHVRYFFYLFRFNESPFETQALHARLILDGLLIKLTNGQGPISYGTLFPD